MSPQEEQSIIQRLRKVEWRLNELCSTVQQLTRQTRRQERALLLVVGAAIGVSGANGLDLLQLFI